MRQIPAGLLLLLASGPATAAPPAHRVPLPCSLEALARAAGLEATPPDPLFDLTLRLYPAPRSVTPASAAQAQVLELLRGASPAAEPAAGGTLELPLSAEAWDEAIFDRAVPPGSRLLALLEDRRAALVYRGLAALDAPTLAFFERERGLLRRLHRAHPEAFALFAAALSVDAAGVRLPGGPEHGALWAAAVGAPVEPAAGFVEALFAREAGAGAWLLATLQRLDPPRRRFALGLTLPRPEQAERFQALARCFARAAGWWRPGQPTRKHPVVDPPFLLALLEVEEDGRLAAPAARAVWEAVFAEDPERVPADAARTPAADAAWLASRLLETDAETAARRLRAVAFGQRRLAREPDARRAARVLAGYLRHEALLLTLERVGVDDALVLARASRVAARLEEAGPRQRLVVGLALFQGALGLVERARFAHSLEAATAGALVRSLLEAAEQGGVARWLDEELLPRLADAVGEPWPEASAELVLARALSGDTPARRAARSLVEWEGLRLRVDVAGAERRRIAAARRRQRGNRLDVVLELQRAARGLERGDAAAAAALAAAAGRLEPAAPPGLPEARAHPERFATRPAGTGRLASRGDTRQALALADTLLSDVLASLLYAALLGPPDAPVLAGENVAWRHLLVAAGDDAAARARPWELPRQSWGPHVRWHVQGSLLALDTALAPYALRRLDAELPPHAPALGEQDRQAFAEAVALLDPFGPEDGERDAIAAAIARGEQRAPALLADADAAAALAERLAIEGRRRARLVRLAADAPAAAAELLTLGERLALGDPPESARLSAWGVPGVQRTGELALAPAPAPLAACPGSGPLAGCFPDLTLRVARELAALALPAALARPVLARATSDLVDLAQPLDRDDAARLAEWVRALPRERFEDYVSSLVGGDALVPDEWAAAAAAPRGALAQPAVADPRRPPRRP